jgi:predicted transcriptional regulator of viral defense system
VGMAYAFQLEELARLRSLFRARDIERAGIPRAWLYWTVHFRDIQRLSRGVYAAPNDHIPDAVVALARAPTATICLASALYLHGLLEAPPAVVWLAIHSAAHAARIETPPTCFVRLAHKPLTFGVERRQLTPRFDVPVYSVAKTLADCLKFRKLVGERTVDIVVQRAIAERRVTRDQFVEATEICRVASAARRYLCSFE